MPGPLPDPGDDFDWLVRDYAGFRQVMLEELAARFSERSRWTAADLEMVLVEAFLPPFSTSFPICSTVLSTRKLSWRRRSAPSRCAASSSSSVIDALALAKAGNWPPFDQVRKIAPKRRSDAERFDRYWLCPSPGHGRCGAGAQDHALDSHPAPHGDGGRIMPISWRQHPLVLRAHAWSRWSGSWTTIRDGRHSPPECRSRRHL